MKKNLFILTESEKRDILLKHASLGYNFIKEDFDATKNYTVTDIQNKLKELGQKYGDMLGSAGADGVFGSKTKDSIISALDDIKSGALVLKKTEEAPKGPQLYNPQ